MWRPTLLATLIPVTTAAAVHGQREILDGPENPCHRDTALVPDAPLREADVMWARRVWRFMDAREAANLPFSAPKGSKDGCYGLWDVITSALREGALTAYDPGPRQQDDAFNHPLSPAQVVQLLNATDSSGAPLYTSATITRFQLKEDWIFDKQRSQLRVFIIGIAPMRPVIGSDGEIQGYVPLFWLHYPHCRPVFAEWVAPNNSSDKARSTFEVLFRARHFTSQVLRVSEVTGDPARRILVGLDAQVEGARLEQELRRFEHDLWSY